MSILARIKPLLWLLFSAGGTLAAFVLPVFLFILAVAVPLQLISVDFLDYHYLKNLLTHSWWLKLGALGFFGLIFWHAMHRLWLTFIDLLHIKHYNNTLALLFYSFTLLITVYVALLLLWL